MPIGVLGSYVANNTVPSPSCVWFAYLNLMTLENTLLCFCNTPVLPKHPCAFPIFCERKLK